MLSPERGRLNFESAYNVYLGLPGDGDRLELTVNLGRDEPYDLGEGYNHVAVTVDDLEAVLARLGELGVQPEKPPYRPGGRDELLTRLAESGSVYVPRFYDVRYGSDGALLAVTSNRPCVSVPVLSNATAFTRPSVSMKRPPLNRMPWRAAFAIADRMVAGVAITSAHGEATTRRVMAR